MFSWTLHQKGSPQGGVAVAVRHTLYYFGRNADENSEDQIDVQVFNTVSLLWRKLTPGRGEPRLEVPSRCRGHTAVLIEDIIYLWGCRECYADDYCNLLYAFDVDTHTWFKPQVSGAVPERRMDHSACVLGKVMYVHGGCICRTVRYCRINDMYKLDTSTMVWSLVNTRGTSPPVSDDHSAIIIRTKMFVFGGWGCGQYNNTIRVFDTETNHWLDTPSAQLLQEEHFGHSAFTYNGDLYIFGGFGFGRALNNVWKFSPETFSWKKVEPMGKGPAPNYNRMCCCMVGDRIILFGGLIRILEHGKYKYTSSDELYVLDLSPSLKTLCKLAVVQYRLEQSELPHNIRWELAANSN